MTEGYSQNEPGEVDVPATSHWCQTLSQTGGAQGDFIAVLPAPEWPRNDGDLLKGQVGMDRLGAAPRLCRPITLPVVLIWI